MKYNIKVGEKYLVGESTSETIKGTVRGDTTAVYSRYVGEMSKYDFCEDRAHAEDFACVTAWDYVRGIMERQNYGVYLGEIKVIDSDSDETVATCSVKKNALLVSHIMEFDAIGKEYDWYEQHIEQILERQKAKAAPEWISVETPPEAGQRVILRAGVFVGEGYRTLANTYGYAAYRITGIPMRDLTDQPVTHWMPLPEPPKEVRDG